ncbi:hypothetical protein R82526_02822 [Ralstonia mannitolilytica]|uniref:PoNe immunity protein domain-containing protein n=1 Tax=Ralstonia mannitolilytica TaxID=105219 RepID=UPI0007B085AD|nr:PoNe immunity protein domain-containing protein [Ralstonia mannitolilytica]CAJ0686484.1 hypothetical protein R82526_02822 [Ralstonia mannitolilytica]CAJ0701846.1 hypothetical protein LMG18102_03572 [Ralstonia mannitolilytica]
MTEATFRSRRRQKFLTERFYELNKSWLSTLILENESEERNNVSPSDPAFAGIAGSTFKEKLNLLKLHYTAGSPIEALLPLYTDAVNALGNWHEAYRTYIKALAAESGDELREDSTPLEFEDLYAFQIAIDMVSLGVLFGDGAALRKIADWLHPYRSDDILFEELVSRAVPDPQHDITEYFHVVPYDALIDSFYSPESPAASAAEIEKYLAGWYKAFEGAPWHDGHVHAAEHQIPYYGYWSFESAAISVLHNIDDRSFRDQLVYPKDLADWARANKSVERLAPDAGIDSITAAAGMRCDANSPCPRAGYWMTPAKRGSRRYFKLGEIMPEVASDYGATIWQWDSDQSDPKL